MDGTFVEEPGSGTVAIIENKKVSVGTLDWVQRYCSIYLFFYLWLGSTLKLPQFFSLHSDFIAMDIHVCNVLPCMGSALHAIFFSSCTWLLFDASSCLIIYMIAFWCFILFNLLSLPTPTPTPSLVSLSLCFLNTTTRSHFVSPLRIVL